MDSRHKVTTSIICFLMILSLSGCGGGGGDSTTPPPTPSPNTAPVANAGPDQTVTLSFPDTAMITLTGTSSDSDGTVESHQWVQTGGAAVTLTGATTSSATFTVDAVTDAYSFSYTVTDDDGAQHTSMVSVYVTEIIFSDSFADASNWVFEDNTNNGDDWMVDSGTLRQSSNLENISNLEASFANNTSYHLGTYARLDTAISGQSAYRFSVDITPLTDFPDNGQGNDVGIMFGLQDDLNYYRVSMSARYGFTRFEKRRSGAFQTLAVNAIGYVDNQPMTMTAEVNGDTIIVWIDGDPVFAVVDSDILSGTVALYCQDSAQFDNVQITENPLQPVVVISTPLAYSITLTQDDGNTLTAEAVALNIPAGGGVSFRMDNGSENAAVMSGNVYARDFSSVAPGEHELAAILKYADGTEAGSDINSTVGVGGDYYVTVGDSITSGVGDDNDSNNDSADGRIVAIQGFQAGQANPADPEKKERLADALTTATGLPQIVFNEGIEGDQASDLISRIASILERHPGANKVLLLIGTNDSPVGNNIFPDTFKSQVETIISNVNGKQVWVAKIPPTYIRDLSPLTLDTLRNDRIVDYNLKIQEITDANLNGDTFPGPDFFTIYTNRADLYADFLHPNDTGYQVMADQWALALP